MKKQQTKETNKKDVEDLMSKSAALREQHQNTSERMDKIRKQTEEFLKVDDGENDS